MRSLFVFIALLCTVSSAKAADAHFINRTAVQKFIVMMQKKHGFSPNELKKALSEAEIQPQVIASMTKPYEKKTWDLYKNIFLTEERIQEGLAFYKANQALLQKAEQTYGVPASIIVAIIGVETLYGKRQGTYRVLDALTTLAFDYPPRAPFFTNELTEFFILCREHHIAPTEYYGSYAGAMGIPQFMPSSYRRFAADFRGQAKKDLMHDNEAVIASIANYLQKHGWSKNQPVAVEATITGTGYKRLDSQLKKAVYSPRQLHKAQVKPMHPLNQEPSKAGLIELNLKQGYEYWIGYPNFYVITRYNSSPQYALAVYLLSQEFEKQRKA